MRILKKDGIVVNVANKLHDVDALFERLAQARRDNEAVALDFETTSLQPSDGRVRLTSVSFSDNEAYVIDHDKTQPFADMAGDLLDCGPFYVFNANFEGRWFSEYCREDQYLDLTDLILDIAHMQRSVMGGGPLWLKTMAKKALNVELDKAQQNSNWSDKVLTAGQYFYSGCDSIYTRAIALHWAGQMTADHWRGFHVINSAWLAVNECEVTGLLLDTRWHKRLIKMWERRRQAAEVAFRRFVPESQVQNIRSKKQISDMLKRVLDHDAIEAWPKTDKTAQLQTSRDILRSMSYISPYPLSRALAALMVFNRADKYIGTYGETLITKQELAHDGRVHSRLNMAQAITGRFSSSNPNQQNFPRHPLFRFSFIAGQGYKLLIADYSGVEIRVLAELSGDMILLHDAIYDDVHARSAIAIYQIKDEDAFLALLKAKDPKAKEMRSRAKAFTFQLLYGAGPGALAIALRCSVDEAMDAINKWAARYQKAYHYRQFMFETMRSSGFLPCASGRTIFVHRNDRTMPVAANYPIQGSAADVMYRAMYHTQRLLYERGVDGYLQASVHDEMLVLAREDCAKEALAALEEGMRLGWLDIFPDSNTDHLADGVIADRWSEKA